MAKKTTKTKKVAKKVDVYEIVTEKVLELLARGVVPWRRTWKAGPGSASPTNLKSRKAYRGINVLLLWAAAVDAGYVSPYWVTFNQAKALGGSVRKGEKSTLVVFWRWVEKKEVDEVTGERKRFPMLRYYRVFNVEQCDGLEGKVPGSEDADHSEPKDRIAAAEAIVASMPNPPTLEFVGRQPCYNVATDVVRVPPIEDFESAEEFYVATFHELAHATGHASRLARETCGVSAFGSETYSKEELVAEMAAAFLAGEAGISEPTIANSAAYLENWRSRISADPKLVVCAAATAQRAADYVLGRKFETEGD